MTDAPQNGAARPMSRRARREAERSAEREAFLTGQQPLLTRREMRRLREEQEALREAVASGELTADEAQALQSPMAEMDIKSHTLHEHNSFEPIREPLLGTGPGDATTSRSSAAPSAPGFPSAPSAPAASAPVVTPGDDLRDTRVVPTAASRMPEGAGHAAASTFPPVNTAAANAADSSRGGLPTHLASSSPTAGSAASFGISAASATSAGAGPLEAQASTQPVVHVNSAHAGAPSLPTYPARSRRAASAASAPMATSASAYSSLSAPSAAPAVNGRATRRRANAAIAPSSLSATAASATAASADLASRAGTRSRRRAAASAASAPSIFSATAASADLAGVNAVSARSAASAPSAFSASAPSALSGTAASAASANSAVSDFGADLPQRRTVFNAVSAPTPSAAPRSEAALRSEAAPASPFLPVHSVLNNPPAQPASQSAHSAQLPVAQPAAQSAPVQAPGGGEQGPLWQSVAADRTQPVPSADEAGDWNVSTAAYAPVNEPLADAQPTPGQAEPAPMRRRSLLGGNAQPAPTPAPAANETPARRPIVRAPSVAKGVREVDTNTGELTIIKPANPNPPVVQRTPEIVSTQDEFEEEVVPNWGAFSQARANQQANSAPNEALADTGLYDRLEDDESSQDGRGLRIFLTMLLIIVLALVVAAVVWFVVLDGGSTNALGLELPKLE